MKNNISYFRSFFEILVKPAETFKVLVAEDPGYGQWVLIPIYTLLAGINPTFYLVLLKFLPAGAALPAEILMMMVVGMIFYWLTVICNFLIGKWLGGTGTLGKVATAYAWAYVPCFGGLILMRLGEIPKWALIMGGETDLRTVGAAGNITMILTILPAMVFFLWSWVLIAFGVSEAHKISLGRAFGVLGIFFGFLVLVGVVIGFVAFAMILKSMGH